MKRLTEARRFSRGRSARHRPRLSGVARLFIVLFGIVVFLYGVLAWLIASAWGPGNSDELVSGGPELIPWYGFSIGGMVAALVAVVLAFASSPVARWVLLLALVSLLGWTAFAMVIGD